MLAQLNSFTKLTALILYKSRITGIRAVCLMILLLSVLLLANIGSSTNLVNNPGFETNDDSKWQYSPSGRCVPVDRFPHSGSKSLQITCSGQSEYASTRQVIHVPDRGTFRFNLWIKLNDLKGEGAYFTMSWYNNSGKLISRYYSSPLVGTLDWTNIKIDNKVPEGADIIIIGLHTYPKCYGEVFYDDVSIEIQDEATLQALLRYPVYRETIYPGKTKQIIIGAEAGGSSDYRIETLKVSVDVLDKNGTIVADTEKENLKNGSWVDIPLDLPDVAPGNYRAVVKLIDKQTGSELKSKELPFHVADDAAPIPNVYIDEQNRCVVDGELFFPLGYYTWGTDSTYTAYLDRVVETRFNCVIHYNILSGRTISHSTRYMNAVGNRGLKIILSTKHCLDNFSNEAIWFGPWEGAANVTEGAVTAFKTHPALLGWYTNDERSDFFLPQLERAYNFIINNDPNHPVYQEITRRQYAVSHMASADILGSHYYPLHDYVTNKLAEPDFSEVAKATGLIRKSTMDARAVWEAIECCKMSSRQKTPSFEEMMCSSYLALTSGARGLFFFCLPWAVREGDSQINALKAVGEEMEKIKPIALGLDAAPEQSVMPKDDRINAITRIVGRDVYVLAVNPTKEIIQVTYKLGKDARAGIISVNSPKSETRNIRVRDGLFTDEIEPMGTRVYKLIPQIVW